MPTTGKPNFTSFLLANALLSSAACRTPKSTAREPARVSADAADEWATPGRVLEISTDRASCARMTDNTVYCWGGRSAETGQPGYGFGNAIPVQIAGLTDARKIAVGIDHGCALRRDGSVWCWGNNHFNQLGDPAAPPHPDARQVPRVTGVVDIVTSGMCTCTLDEAGAVRCWGVGGFIGPDDPAQQPTTVTALPPVVEIAMSINLCGRTSTGEVRCVGGNYYGELGNGVRFTRGGPDHVLGLKASHISVGDSYACAINSNREVFCWGYNLYGQLGNGQYPPSSARGNDVPDLSLSLPGRVIDLQDVQSISTGRRHACAVRHDGSVACWGSAGVESLPGYHGPRTALRLVGGLPPVQQVSAGENYTCVRTRNNQAWCWGYNGNGGLGDGTRADRSTPRQVWFPNP